MGAWSIAEATVWPIMPDFVLAPLAFFRVGSWWRLVLAAAVGTALGSWATYRAARRGRGHDAAWQPWLVRPRMVAIVREWLASEGAHAVRRQPASGVPIKVFAHEAGGLGVPLVPFVTQAVAARTARFVLAAGGAALVRRLAPPIVARHPWLLLTSWGIVFGLGLWRAVAAWTDVESGEGRKIHYAA